MPLRHSNLPVLGELIERGHTPERSCSWGHDSVLQRVLIQHPEGAITGMTLTGCEPTKRPQSLRPFLFGGSFRDSRVGQLPESRKLYGQLPFNTVPTLLNVIPARDNEGGTLSTPSAALVTVFPARVTLLPQLSSMAMNTVLAMKLLLRLTA